MSEAGKLVEQLLANYSVDKRVSEAEQLLNSYKPTIRWTEEAMKSDKLLAMCSGYERVN